MRFLIRALVGMLLFALGAGLLALGGMRLSDAMAPVEDGAWTAAGAQERIFTVAGQVVELGQARPTLTAYGVIESWRTLRLGADAAGRVTWLSPELREGARVEAGETLLKLDPAAYEAAEAEARAALAEAKADRREAEAGLESARLELEAARTQTELRRASLERQSGLADRGFAAASAQEEAELALAAAEQSVASAEQAVVAAQLRIERAELAEARARLALDEAGRALGETELVAPFAGLLTEVSVGLGDLLAAGETLGRLLDPEALEAALTLSGPELARLRRPDKGLVPAEVSLALEPGGEPVAFGRLARAAAQAEAGGAARRVYVRIERGQEALRPGDFVIGRIVEPALENVATLPAAAVDEAGRLLVVTEEERLRELEVEVLRRQDDEVVVAGAPDGATVVAARAPQLGAGVKVRVVAQDGAPPAVGGRIALGPGRREELIAFVRSQTEYDEARREKLLEALTRPEPPVEVVEEVEALMHAASG